MRHLILGGGGFVGCNLGNRLISMDHDVDLIDIDFPAFRQEVYDVCGTAYADLRETRDCEDIINPRANYDIIWQLAADMGGVEYFHSEHDWQAAVNNQLINVNVMDVVARNAPNSRVVFTSTACALATEKQTHNEMVKASGGHPTEYSWSTEGDGNGWTLKESDIAWGTPDQLYGQEKRNSALLWKAAPIDTRVAFLHTVYGPYQEHSGIRMKFPSAVAQKARKARRTGRIELLGDGRQVRTYLYIDDAIDRLLVLGLSKEDPGFLNIGGGEPYTVDEVACIALEAAGKPFDQVEFVHVPGPTGVEARACDMTKFNTAFPGILGGVAQDVSLVNGMGRFIDWLDQVDP